MTPLTLDLSKIMEGGPYIYDGGLDYITTESGTRWEAIGGMFDSIIITELSDGPKPATVVLDMDDFVKHFHLIEG